MSTICYHAYMDIGWSGVEFFGGERCEYCGRAIIGFGQTIQQLRQWHRERCPAPEPVSGEGASKSGGSEAVSGEVERR